MAETHAYKAHARYLLIAATKLRRIATHLRRKPYPEAVALLENLPHKGARMLKKVIQSAAANAMVKNKGLDEDMLFVRELLVNEGPRMKRLWLRGKGRADVLLKRMSHISVTLDEITKAGA